MPAKLEAELKESAAKHIPIPEDASPEERKRLEQRRNAYIFGTLRKTGWRPGREQA